uniref:Uncharacterized protein n=2 Tax=Amphora coffeiformis TaxID=265554 RepID=A0A7S3KVP1_9STRA
MIAAKHMPAFLVAVFVVVCLVRGSAAHPTLREAKSMRQMLRELDERVATLEGALGGLGRKTCVGKTAVNSWQAYTGEEDATWVTVDIAHCGFDAADDPLIFTTLVCDAWGWKLTGTTSIYRNDWPESFDVFLKNMDPPEDFDHTVAKEQNFQLQYMAILQ